MPFVLAVLLAACGSGDADGALSSARAAASHADYLVVSDGRGLLLLSKQLTVIERNGRVVAWTQPREEYTLRTHRRCYERHTDYNRADVADTREAALPPELRGGSLRTEGSRRVVAVRERHDDFADTEYEVVIDAAGRPVFQRTRSAKNGAVPASAWSARRYDFVSRVRFELLAGRRPQPRC